MTGASGGSFSDKDRRLLEAEYHVHVERLAEHNAALRAAIEQLGRDPAARIAALLKRPSDRAAAAQVATLASEFNRLRNMVAHDFDNVADADLVRAIQLASVLASRYPVAFSALLARARP